MLCSLVAYAAESFSLLLFLFVERILQRLSGPFFVSYNTNSISTAITKSGVVDLVRCRWLNLKDWNRIE